jgi:hypothetical protein
MRIVIAEASAVMRAGLAEILADSGHEVVAAVGNADDLLAAVAGSRSRSIWPADALARRRPSRPGDHGSHDPQAASSSMTGSSRAPSFESR